MKQPPKKTRILSVSIVEKAIAAIEARPEIDEEVLDNVRKYGLQPLLDYYRETTEELSYQFDRRKIELTKINDLFITRERVFRILKPTIYLNAYKEKRANDAIYINANVGFIDEKGKVKNVVVFMGKSDESSLERLQKKIETDGKFLEDAKKKVIEKLMGKIKIPHFSKEDENRRRDHKSDIIPEMSTPAEIALHHMAQFVKKVDGGEKKSLQEAVVFMKQVLKHLKAKE